MAFVTDLVKRALGNENTPDPTRKVYNPTAGLPSLPKLEGLPKLSTPFSFNQDLDTSQGLYNLAYNSGLRDQADEIVRANAGESQDEIFSGGFISDIFDTLNVFQYGVVGLLKGQTFLQGVKNRESFSDKDSLGGHGLLGSVAGLILDIAVDPLTYIGPWTVLKKIPGVSVGASALKEASFGKRVTKGIEGTELAYSTLEGGIKPLRILGEKFQWMFGADPVFKETYEQMMRNSGVATRKAVEMIRPVAKLDPKIAKELFVTDKEGRFARRSIEELQSILKQEDFANIQGIWKQIDDMGKQLVELGVLGKGKFEENFGKYLKNYYMEYELMNKRPAFASKILGLRNTTKTRKAVENVSEFGLTQIEDPAYLLGHTMIGMVHDIENAKLFKAVNKSFATDIAQEGFTKLPDTIRFKTSQGIVSELSGRVGEINKVTKSLQKELAITHRADKALLKELSSLDKDIKKIASLQGDELFKFLNEGEVVNAVTKTGRRLGTLPDALQPLAERLRKFDTFEAAFKSEAGLDLERLWMDGVLERSGFKGADAAMKDFYNFAKNPFKPATVKTGEKVLEGNLPKLVKLQKQLDKLMSKSSTLKAIDKTSVNNSFIHLEKNISDLAFQKEDILAAINRNKLGDLAGKYVPDSIAKYLDEVITPTERSFSRHIMSEFKYMKVVMSPSTHVRNTISNRILNWWELGIGPWRVDLDAKVMKALKEGPTNEFIRRAEKWGYNADTFIAAELKNNLKDPSLIQKGGKAVKAWAKMKDKLGNIYQAEENYAKLSAFIHQVGKGLSDKDAWLAAESATFNYAHVTPFVRKLRTAIWGVPFITFPLKATPIVAETIGKHPGRISSIGKIKNTIEKAADMRQTDEERASEPQWVKEGFYFKLPWKDAEGRSAYFDLTYIVPFGDLLSGQWLTPATKKDTGTKEPLALSVLSKNPALQLLKELSKNETFSGRQIWRESDPWEKVSVDLSRHILKTMAPPWVGAQLPDGYNSDGTVAPSGLHSSFQNRADLGVKRNWQQEMMSYFGMKVQPFNAELNQQYQEWNTRKGLQTLLRENGVVKDFSRVYVPG